MSNKTLKLIAGVACIAVIVSLLNTYLILENINSKEQITEQENRINELESSLEQLDEQKQIIDELQTTINAQEERITDLQNILNNFTVPTDLIDEQTQQINALQTALTETKNELSEATSALHSLSTNLNSLNQSTSASLSELESTIGSIENVVSEISDIEELVAGLAIKTPADVYDGAHKSVVLIRTPVGQGSGFMYNDQTTIVTNYHVVKNETDIEIQFFDGTRTQATTIGADAYADIAVLEVSSAPSEAVPLTLSEKLVGIGQQVVAIGNPLGLTESLSVGYISQVNRLLGIEPIIVPIIQLDLTIAPGSSGGPLLDLDGKVVGITNAGTEAGFNFAVPIEIMKRVIPALISEGYYNHPLVGFSIVALTPEMITDLNIQNVESDQTGLLVVEVAPGLPAEQAGLMPAVSGIQSITAVDIVLAVDGHPTRTLEEWTAYVEVEVSPNQEITMTIWRYGETELVTVTTTERPQYQE
jgi:S1-C subfamily serine protease